MPNSPLVRSLLIIAIATASLLALVLPIDLGPNELPRMVEDAAHGPLFALAAIGIMAVLRRKPSQTASSTWLYALAFAITVALGAAGELAQLFTETRQAQMKDLLTDICGAITGLCWFARYDKRLQLRSSQKHLLLTTALVAGAMIIAPIAWSGVFYVKRWSQLPELVTWDSAAGQHFLRAGGGNMRLALVPPQWAARDDEAALYISPGNNSRWAGITLEEPWPDWSAYQKLELVVVNPNDAPLELILRIDDRQHNQAYDDRFNRTLVIQAHTRATLQVLLREIQNAPATRRLDLSKISKLVLFQDTERGAHPYYLCGIRIQH